MYSEFALPHPLTSAHATDPARFVSLILGTEWLDDTPVQHACIESCSHSTSILIDIIFARTLGYSPSVEVIKKKKK